MNNINTTPSDDPIYSYQPLWGSWKVDSLIGEGSYGKVYKVVREELGYTYTSAVKIITIPSKEQYREAVSSFGDDEDTLRNYFEGMVENILSEVNLLYRLRGSPNIVVYEDHMVVAKKDGLGWDILIRMEHLTSLPAHLSKNRLNRENIIGLGLDILSAISLCSINNIIHRDIKDENIFVSKNIVFKLGDFGIAKELSRSGKAASFRGTPLFMSPEVFKGEKYDVRSDIYSLGIVMYKLLNKGRVPFMPSYPDKIEYKDSETAIVKRFTGEPITLPTHSGKDLGSIVLKACSYRKEDRYASPEDMKKALQEVLSTMDAKPLNEDVTFLTSAKEEKRVDKTISISGMPIVEKPPIAEDIKKEETTLPPPEAEEVKTAKEEVIVPEEIKVKTNITEKTMGILIPSVILILAVIAVVVFLFIKSSLPGKSETTTQETASQSVPITTENTLESTVSIETIQQESAQAQVYNLNILNGIGTPGIAKTVKSILEEYLNKTSNVIEVKEIKDADNINYGVTEIITHTDKTGIKDIAEKIKDTLGVGEISESSNNPDNVDITVIIGKDYIAETAAESTAKSALEKVEYDIGDSGPAGGIIFYINSNYETDGWRYLEAAPSDQSTKVQWDNRDYVKEFNTGSSSTSIGAGRSNTQKIVNVQGKGNYAAQLCNDLIQGGCSDWFLPSKDELNEMYVNLYLKGLGSFASDYYWNSSESYGNCAWYQDFNYGHQHYGLKNYYYFRVRAVRAF